MGSRGVFCALVLTCVADNAVIVVRGEKEGGVAHLVFEIKKSPILMVVRSSY